MRHALRQPVHSSWMIAVVGLSILAGVVGARIVELPWIATLGWFLTGVFLCLIATIKQKAAFIILAVIGGLLVGLWRGSAEQTALVAYKTLKGKTAQLTGTVADDTDIDKQDNTVVRLKDVSFGDKRLPGTMWVSLTHQAAIERSDHIVVKGEVTDGFGTFAASIYRATLRRTVRSYPGDVALHIRDWFSSLVHKAIPEPAASLGVGFLVGQRRSLPGDLDTALKVAGLTHIVVASGYNLTILVRLARRLLEKTSKYLAALASGGLIVGFMAVTGVSPSMSRAGLVAGLSLAAWYYGRKFHPFVILSIAIATTVLVNPEYAWGDVGWELSFAAFAGVMLLAPLLQAYFFGDKKPGILRQVLGETVSAWLCTLPILLYAFGYLSNVAIVANLLIVPLIPIAMLLTFMAGIATFVAPAFGHVIELPATWLLEYMTHVATWFSNLSWAKTDVTITALAVVAMYAGTIGLTGYLWWTTRLKLRETSLVE